MLILEKDRLKFKLMEETWKEICYYYKALESLEENKLIKLIKNRDWKKGYITLTFNQVEELQNLFSLTYEDLSHGIRQVVKDNLVLRSTTSLELSNTTYNHSKFHISRASLFRDKFIELRSELDLPYKYGNLNIKIDRISDYLQLDSDDYKDSTNTFTKNSKIFYLRKKIEQLGCLVFETDGKKRIDPSEVSGMFVWYDSWPIIILNSNKASYHQRSIFTLMHELYHFLATKDKVYEEGSIITGNDVKIEEEADKFAINCLFPKKVYENISNYVLEDVNELVKWFKGNLNRFGVSEHAQVIKLREEKIIGENMYEKWKHHYEERIIYNKNMKVKGFRRRDNWRESGVGRLRGTNFISLAHRAYLEKNYSLSRLSDFLDVKKSSVEDVFDYWLY